MGDNDNIERALHRSRREPRSRPWIDAAQTPFRDDALMDGSPSCTAADFGLPRLRHCPFEVDSFIWETRLGEGLDGCVWKVRSGNAGPLVLKVFWDYEPPEFAHYYAPQRECQVAALLQMMETAVEKAAAASTPILVNPNPENWDDVLDNQAAFSDEARLKHQSSTHWEAESGYREITTMPRMRKCYGWLTVKSSVLAALPRELQPPVIKVDKVDRFIQPNKEYMAIVSEYIEEGENAVDAVQEAMDFFWLAGFCRTLSPLLKNWMSSVLVDLSDFAPPRGYGWTWHIYNRGPFSAPLLLQQVEDPPAPRPLRPNQRARFTGPLPRKESPPSRSPG